ncbi:MAG: hypothetical protein LBQ37_02410 [Elusimicrobiota bacterium]|jgi:hypothetical protein|nr:hypothetical protein [Elusimicrobiota bacterium]
MTLKNFSSIYPARLGDGVVYSGADLPDMTKAISITLNTTNDYVVSETGYIFADITAGLKVENYILCNASSERGFVWPTMVFKSWKIRTINKNNVSAYFVPMRKK